MRKVLNQNALREQGGLRTLAAVTLTMTLVAFGCTTNQTAGLGEPSRTPAYGPMGPSSTATPGSSSGTSGIPSTMVSASAVDAIAVIEAGRAFQGKILGPADPGGPVVTTPRGVQLPNPSTAVNPQTTVNSSISSVPTPAIVSGAAGDDAGEIFPPVDNATAPAAGSVPTTVTGASTLGNATATPSLGTSAATNTTAGATSVLGISNVPTQGGTATNGLAVSPATIASGGGRLRVAGTSTLTSIPAGIPIRVERRNGTVVVTNQSATDQRVTSQRGTITVTNRP